MKFNRYKYKKFWVLTNSSGFVGIVFSKFSAYITFVPSRGLFSCYQNKFLSIVDSVDIKFKRDLRCL